MVSRTVLLASVLCFALINTAYAMRCGDQLVFEGDNKYNVLAKCGEPLDKEAFEQTVPLYNEAGYQIGENTSIVEQWIYQKSPADFQYILTFDQGVVKKITANRNP